MEKKWNSYKTLQPKHWMPLPMPMTSPHLMRCGLTILGKRGSLPP
ncbi:hypothetical protein [Spirabiliibacterium mucosae]